MSELSQTGTLVILLGGLFQMAFLSVLLARERHKTGRLEAELTALRRELLGDRASG